MMRVPVNDMSYSPCLQLSVLSYSAAIVAKGNSPNVKPLAPIHGYPYNPTSSPMPASRHPFHTLQTGFFRTCCAVICASTSVVAEPPTFDASVPGWLAVRSWMDANSWPNSKDVKDQPSREGYQGLSAVLRLDGRTIGLARSFSDDPAILRRTAGKALGQAMSTPAVASLPEPLQAHAATRFTLELEFASKPEPLLGRTFGAAIKRLRPGIDGIALRRGSRWAYAFPGRMLATATAGSLSATMLRLAAELDLPPKDLDALRELDDVGLYRFETLRLAQSTPTAFPFEVYRCGSIVQPDPTATTVFAASIIDHFQRHRVPSDDERPEMPTFLGDFNVVADRHDPIEASPADRALVAWALATAAASSGVPDDARRAARSLALELLESLNTPPKLDATTAFAVLAASSLHDGNAPLDEFARALLGDHPPAKPALRPLLAAAIATLNVPIETIETNINLAWHNATADFLVSHFDWLAFAERSLATRTGERSARVQVLNDVATMLIARQLLADQSSDLYGAIPLNSNAAYRIDARSLRLGVALHTLEDLGLVVPEPTHEGMLRFARQLQLANPDAALYLGHLKGLGGIRASPWTVNQPLASSAMALVLAAEHLSITPDSLPK